MKLTIITAGEQFTDIDVLACAVAYSELLTLQGKQNEIVLPGVWNSSITPTIRSWGIEYRTEPSTTDADVVMVDVSEAQFFSKFVTEDKIVELYDHRSGFQDFWTAKLGENSHIEYVGACATLIWEQYKERGCAEKISPQSANLLAIAILSNTLNFGSSVTTDRDVQAYKELQQYTNLENGWEGKYFGEVEQIVLSDVYTAILNDTKTFDLAHLGVRVVMGQIELWDARAFFRDHMPVAKKALETLGQPDWFLSSPSISEKKNYIYTESEKIKELLGQIIGIKFDGNVGVTDKLWLRKEIRKKLFEL